eukprot:comp23853_c0_seq2/m.41702 comp23853_c0_seq2/g.41702  ORF comp23853_c0_seq2/g.41702 comp23853_c0_seq2/m.41702 type:complete len:1721 (-) comp23853_c0_seq2:7-5169(-)
MTSKEDADKLLTPGVSIWIDTKQEGIDAVPYVAAEIVSNDGKSITAREKENGKEHTLPMELWDEKGGFFLRNPESMEKAQDLTQLTYLHEPAVLNTLRARYNENQTIYTYCGIVLVALNPFCEVDIYNDFYMDLYHNQGESSDLEPHIFAINEAAYSRMKEGKDQSIVISGESGAGKTKTATYSMRFFSFVGGTGEDRRVEQQLDGSSVILESFGNAKTTRNNNSSRFGKYMSLQFDNKHAICGSEIQTYLLEKSRVVGQSDKERGYHIFYHLLAYNFEESPSELAHLELEDCMAYWYTKQGNTRTSDGINDKQLFLEVRQSLGVFGVNNEMQLGLFGVLAAILHMGNIEFVERRGPGGQEAAVQEGDKSLAKACELLDINAKGFSDWLVAKKMPAVRGESLVKKIDGEQARAFRDAFAKRLYADTFDWIVARINDVLRNPTHKGRFIGILDIYGFEKFKDNSFEQFCINYANEKLQQQFNDHVFKLEQERYRREEIPWGNIAFNDNQPVIDLIEAKGIGVMALLDEEARLQKGSDESFMNKLRANYHKEEPRGKKKAKPEGPFYLDQMNANKVFFITHYADHVNYNIDKFIEKNRDNVSTELLDLLLTSKQPLVKELVALNAEQMEAQKAAESGKAGGAMRVKTVASTFRNSLDSLMATIRSTTPHYVRCLKSNQLKQAFLFQDGTMKDQLIACGVLETIQISAKGYPNQISYEECKKAYSILLPSNDMSSLKKKPLKELCAGILSKVIKDEKMYALGKTLIFFKAGQLGFLDKFARDRMRHIATTIQRHTKGWLARLHYRQMRQSIIIVQALARARIARDEHQLLREERAKLWVRVVLQRVMYNRARRNIIAVQTAARMWLAKQALEEEKQRQLAVMLQSAIRAYQARKYLAWYVRSVVIIQNLWRRRCAKMELRKLKMAERDVSNLKEKTGLLENKIIDLSRKLDEQVAENKRLRTLADQASESKETVQKLHQLEEEKEIMDMQLSDIQSKADQATAALAAATAAAAALEKEKSESEERMRELELEVERMVALDEEKTAQLLEMERKMEKVRAQAQKQAEKRASTALLGTNPLSGSNTPKDPNQLSPVASYENLQGLSMEVPSSREMTGQTESISKRNASLEGMVASLEQRLATLTDTTLSEDDMRLKLADAVKALHDADDTNTKLQDEVSQLKKELATAKAAAAAGTAAGFAGGILASAPSAGRTSSGGLSGRLSGNLSGGLSDGAARELGELRKRCAELELELTLVKREEDVRALQEENGMLREEYNNVHTRLREVQKELRELRNAQSHPGVSRTGSMIGATRQPSMAGGGRKLSGQQTLSRQPTIGTRSLSRQMSRPLVRAEDMPPGLDMDLKGMLAFRAEDKNRLLHALTVDVDPVRLQGETVGIISTILFMCFKYADHEANGELLMGFCTDAISYLSHVLTKNHTNLALLGFWLCNTSILIDMMLCTEDLDEEEYPDYQLENFDVTEFREVLQDIRKQTFVTIVRLGHNSLARTVVPALLEHNMLEQTERHVKDGSDGPRTVHHVIAVLEEHLQVLRGNNVDPQTTSLVMVELVRYVSGMCLNNLLLRKDLCNFNKSLSMGYNINQLDAWLHESKLPRAKEALTALTQAIKLLQMPKTLDSVGTILSECSALNHMQICKILQQYTPETYEDKVPQALLNEVQARGRAKYGNSASPVVDTKDIPDVDFPRRLPTQRLAEVQLPKSLVLPVKLI